MARKWWVLLIAVLLGTALSAQSTGRRIAYAVDPATAVPAATVIHNGEGITVVIFRAAELDHCAGPAEDRVRDAGDRRGDDRGGGAGV